jgi:hypothetical protein
VNKFHIKKISEIDKNKLLQFYQKSFNYEKSVLEDFAWRYRLGFNDFEPLVLIVNNEICGHAGLIPINLKIDNEIKKATWFTDFYISPRCRSLGYGMALTEEWMKICPIQITLCNDLSLRIFKKLNWSHNNTFNKRIKFYNYLNILPTFRKINIYENFTDKLGSLKLEELNNKTLSNIISVSEENLLKKCIGIVRDENWFKWRINSCPYKKDIFIFSYKNTYLITRIKKKGNLKILNVIYSSALFDSNLVAKIFDFSKRNRIDYLSYISNRNTLIDFPVPWKRKLNFAFYTNEASIKNMLNKKFDDIQFIDSDIDYI